MRLSMTLIASAAFIGSRSTCRRNCTPASRSPAPSAGLNMADELRRILEREFPADVAKS
jgi:hypothetical protein